MHLSATYSIRPPLGSAFLAAAALAAMTLAGASEAALAQDHATPSDEQATALWDGMRVAVFAGAREGFMGNGKIYGRAPVYGADATIDVGGGAFAMVSGRHRSAIRGECPASTICTLETAGDPGETLVSVALGWSYRGPLDLGVHAGPAWVTRSNSDFGALAGVFLHAPTPVDRVLALVGIDAFLRPEGEWEGNFRNRVQGMRFGGGLTLRAGLAFRP